MNILVFEDNKHLYEPLVRMIHSLFPNDDLKTEIYGSWSSFFYGTDKTRYDYVFLDHQLEPSIDVNGNIVEVNGDKIYKFFIDLDYIPSMIGISNEDQFYLDRRVQKPAPGDMSDVIYLEILDEMAIEWRSKIFSDSETSSEFRNIS